MPRSIFCVEPRPGVARTTEPSSWNRNFCWFMAVGASKATLHPVENQFGTGSGTASASGGFPGGGCLPFSVPMAITRQEFLPGATVKAVFTFR